MPSSLSPGMCGPVLLRGQGEDTGLDTHGLVDHKPQRSLVTGVPGEPLAVPRPLGSGHSPGEGRPTVSVVMFSRASCMKRLFQVSSMTSLMPMTFLRTWNSRNLCRLEICGQQRAHWRLGLVVPGMPAGALEGGRAAVAVCGHALEALTGNACLGQPRTKNQRPSGRKSVPVLRELLGGGRLPLHTSIHP